MKPFEQLAFEDVPEVPRVPHGYALAKKEHISLSTRHFGEIDVVLRRFGSGPPLLLVHGFMTSSYSFRYLIEPLSKSFELFIPDFVGAGDSAKPDVSYHPDHLADFLGDFIDALGIRGATVIGNSLGGYLSMRLALREPEKMGRLVCVHAPGLPTARMFALRFALNAFPFAGRLVNALIARNPERWVHRNVHYFDETLKSREEHREYAAPLRTVEGRRAFFRTLSEALDVKEMQNFEARLRTLGGVFPVPLLMVYARRDPMVPPAVGERFARLLHESPIAWIDGGSHFCHVDSVDSFLDAITAFIAPRA
jgi:pimeloyl-ACP methyl ester carboxylesterase